MLMQPPDYGVYDPQIYGGAGTLQPMTLEMANMPTGDPVIDSVLMAPDSQAAAPHTGLVTEAPPEYDQL